jgi:integrase
MPLTDTALRKLKPGEKIRRVADERGMYLEITPAGGRYWRLKYRFAGKEKKLALGIYPEVTLREARERRDEARQRISKGVDPGVQKRRDRMEVTRRATNSFEAVGREWFAAHASGWSASHTSRNLRFLERDLFPVLGTRPIAEIEAPELLEAVRRVERRVRYSAHRALRVSGQVFRYAIATGSATRNIALDLRGALPPTTTKHLAATLEPRRLGAILRAMDGYEGSPAVRAALRLAPMLFVRPGELRRAEWASINLDTAEWRYLVTKTKTEHLVPLCSQAIIVLRELQPVTGRGRFVFPSGRGLWRPMSDNAVLAAMRTLGITREEMTGHGFRAVARTLLDEVHGFRADIIEHQLAHAVRDPNGRAYNRTSFLDERRRMMQAWADYLDHLKLQILVMPKRAAG